MKIRRSDRRHRTNHGWMRLHTQPWDANAGIPERAFDPRFCSFSLVSRENAIADIYALPTAGVEPDPHGGPPGVQCGVFSANSLLAPTKVL
jgi:hypothetical protein